MSPRTKLFVGHLPDGLRTEELQELFSKYGSVTECDVINKYGFVHMGTEAEAEEALKNLNNYNFMGSTLSVERSTSKFHQEPGAPGRAKGGPRPPYGQQSQRNGYDSRPSSGGYYNGGPGYGDYRRGGGADFYDRAPYRAMPERPRPYPVPYERRDDPYAPRRPLPPSMGPDMYERRRAPQDYSLYSRRSPPPASGYSWGAGYGAGDRMGGYSYGGY